MSKIANLVLEEVDNILIQSRGISSLETISKALEGKLSLSNDKNGAMILENLGYSVSEYANSYYVRF